MASSLHISIISPEISPFNKVGGLADVAHALPKHIQGLGHRASVVTPYYAFMDKQNLAKELVGEVVIPFGRKEYPVKFLRTSLSPTSPVPVYFVYQEELFSRRDRSYGYPDDNLRFAVFNLAVFYLYELLGKAPDVLHCQDWPAGLVPQLLRKQYADNPFWSKTSTLFTIHNLPFQMQGMWYLVPAKKRDTGRTAIPTDPEKIRTINFTLRAILYSDVINTVSERYALEIMTKKFGEGLDGYLRRRKDRVYGIINGIDYSIFNPSFDQHLDIHYDWNSLDKKIKNKLALQKELGLPTANDIPMIGLVHRLTEQKGFNVIMEILPTLMYQRVQLVIVGDGHKEYVKYFRNMAKKYPEQIAVHLEFSEAMGSRVYAASDMFLMPSRYEPCGISQLISLRYGSIPIVHQTGGLADTITDFDPRTGLGNGFVFHAYSGTELLMALTRALETFKYPKVWEHLTWQAMRQSFSWQLPATKYIQLYRRAIKLHHAVD